MSGGLKHLAGQFKVRGEMSSAPIHVFGSEALAQGLLDA